MPTLIQAKNNTERTISYSSEGVSITAGSTVTIPNAVLKRFSLDAAVILDILSGNVSIGDGTTLYTGASALDLIKNALDIVLVAPLSAGAGTAGNVGVSSSEVVAANAARSGLIAVNTSAAVISIGIGVPAVLYSGITLYPGSAWNMDRFSYTTDAINAIAASASSNLAIQEFS